MGSSELNNMCLILLRVGVMFCVSLCYCASLNVLIVLLLLQVDYQNNSLVFAIVKFLIKE